MKQLTVLRHAKSSWGDPQLADFERPLNARGRHAAESVGRELKRRQVAIDCIVASPAVRVRQTLDLFGSGFGPLPQPDFVSGNYAASVQQLLDVVCALPDACSSVLLVGHNPGLRGLILALAGSPSKLRHRVADNYPTAAAAIIRFDADRWEAAGGGEILDLILPRELDSEV